MKNAATRWMTMSGFAQACLGATLSAMLIASGCQSNGGSTASESDAVTAYESGNYSVAYDEAVRDYRTSSGWDRDQAALLAGLAAYAKKDYTEARRWLEPLKSHRSREISGRAYATLGLIDVAENDHANAAPALAAAGRRLTADEAARSYLYAGDSYSELGRSQTADVYYRLAASKAIDRSLRNTIDSRISQRGFTIQIGAFSEIENARRAAMNVAPMASRIGLSEPEIVPGEDASGRSLYRVHVGQFETERDAKSARVRLGAQGVVTRTSLR